MSLTQSSPSPQLSSSPSPNNPTVVVVVVVSIGGLALLSLLAFALFCFFQKTKNKKTQETNIIHIDEHKKGKETIVPGPFGQQAVVIEVEDDMHVDEVKKSEKLGHGLHAESSSSVARIDDHKKGKETIVPGPFGQQAVVVEVEDDVHVDEVKKSEKVGHGLHAESSSSVARIDEHKKGKETVVPGPFGKQAVEISVEDDVHVDEVKKTEKLGGEQQHHHQLENKP